MTEDERDTLARITVGLMVADNLGDVHEAVDDLHDLLGLPRPHGSYLEGWTDQDWARLRG